jgi:hypothetical protein
MQITASIRVTYENNYLSLVYANNICAEVRGMVKDQSRKTEGGRPIVVSDLQGRGGEVNLSGYTTASWNLSPFH